PAIPATSNQQKYLNQPKGGCPKNKEILRYMEFFNRTNVLSVNCFNEFFFGFFCRLILNGQDVKSK
ncbi:MAG: hypothetical protein AB1523_13295, partial [Bacillota bacterium]